jgi:putative lipoic acid-binding regulatory protein
MSDDNNNPDKGPAGVDTSLDNDEKHGLNFPCEYPVKAMGPNTEAFTDEIYALVKNHCPELKREDVTTRASGSATYQSVTLPVRAESRDHLIGIYQDLKNHKDVKWTL